MSEQCPVTITVHEYYTQNFIAKVAKKECKVSVPGYAVSWIEDVEDVRGMYFVKFQDHEGQHSFNFEPDDKLTVYWLPQPEREEAAHKCNRCDGQGQVVAGWDNDAYENIEGVCPDCRGSGKKPAPLLPQTVRDGDATLLGSKSIISPSEFLSGEYAYKIACDECQVTCFGQRIRTLSKRDDKGNYMIWPLNDSEVSGMAHDDDKLIVTWFPHIKDEWHEAGVKLDREEAAAREFADGWRDAEIARLQGDKSKLREALRNIAATARSERGAIRRLHTIETLATEALSMFVDSEPDHK